MSDHSRSYSRRTSGIGATNARQNDLRDSAAATCSGLHATRPAPAISDEKAASGRRRECGRNLSLLLRFRDRLTHWLERRAQLFRKELWLFPGCEVTAFGNLVIEV